MISKEEWIIWKNHVGKGWWELLEDMKERLDELDEEERESNPEWEGWSVSQIKEKFGRLRSYINGTRKQQDVANFYENLSYHVCEYCGYYGRIRQTGWIKTLCDECYAEWDKDLPTVETRLRKRESI